MYHCLHFNDGHFFFVDVPAPIMSIRFDPTSRFILTSGDKYVRVFHNVPGYKVAIGKLNLKLREASNQTNQGGSVHGGYVKSKRIMINN